jgi:hypothetical protein
MFVSKADSIISKSSHRIPTFCISYSQILCYAENNRKLEMVACDFFLLRVKLKAFIPEEINVLSNICGGKSWADTCMFGSS